MNYRDFPRSQCSIVAAVEEGGFYSAPAGCEVRSVINFLNAQRIARIEIHHTGLVFGKFRVQIPVLNKLIGVHFIVSLSLKANRVEFVLPLSI